MTGSPLHRRALLAGGGAAVLAAGFRAAAGGDFPHVATAPVLHNRQPEIRQPIIDRVRERGEIDPAAFHRVDWRLVVDGTPVVVG